MSAQTNVAVYRVIIGLLLLTIVGLALKFVILGKTETAVDGRVAIILEPAERAVVLNEMRQFLAGIQGMLDAADRGDAAAIAKIARSGWPPRRVCRPGWRRNSRWSSRRWATVFTAILTALPWTPRR